MRGAADVFKGYNDVGFFTASEQVCPPPASPSPLPDKRTLERNVVTRENLGAISFFSIREAAETGKKLTRFHHPCGVIKDGWTQAKCLAR